jgi:hypothetical protein
MPGFITLSENAGFYSREGFSKHERFSKSDMHQEDEEEEEGSMSSCVCVLGGWGGGGGDNKDARASDWTLEDLIVAGFF